MSEHLLSVQDLHTSFFTERGEVQAVNGVSFDLDVGSTLGIVGESGSGKSVTAYSIMKILADTAKIKEGKILYKGEDISKWDEKKMRNFRGKCCSIIFQDPMTSLNPVFSVGNQIGEAIRLHNTELQEEYKKTTGKKRKILAIVCCVLAVLVAAAGVALRFLLKADPSVIKGLLGFVFGIGFSAVLAALIVGNIILTATDPVRKKIKAKSAELIDLVGITDPKKRLKQYPYEHSGGMRQRVMIAMALACDPDILIADEPTTALDVTIQAQILELIQDLQKKLGMAVILVTHDLGVIADMCDDIIVMYGGRVCERGTASEIFYNPKHEYTKGLLKSIPNVNNMKEKLVPIAGTPINMLNLPKGCAFCARCDNCMKICMEEVPEELFINENHRAACWMNIKEVADEETKGACGNE